MQIRKFIALTLFIFIYGQSIIGQSIEPVIVTVTVDTLIPNNQGRVKIIWEPNQHPDVVEYGIYRAIEQGKFIEIDRVRATETNFVDDQASANISSSGYRMASFLSGSADPSILVDPHFTVYLQASTFDYCKQNIEITWSNYIGWESNLASYDIFRKNGNQPYQLIASVSANGDTVFAENNVDYNRIYKYYIKANNSNGTQSLSNIVQVITDAEQSVDLEDLYIDSLRYDGSKVQVVFNGIQSDLISKYNIYYQQSNNSEYRYLESVENTLNQRYQYFDENPSNEGRYYTISANDLCNDSLGLSNTIRQVVLDGSMTDNVVNLSWNNGFDEIDESFDLYMQVDGSDFEMHERVSNLNQANYDLTEIGDGNSENFCFRIDAGLPIGYTSQSNAKCFTIKPIVTIPTAFTPNGDGLNDYIIPKIEYADIQEYEFLVYDKYGGRIFETTNQSFKWDGKSSGKSVKEGAYLFYLKFTTRWGNSYEESGVINIIYP